MLDNSFLVLSVAAPGKFTESNIVSFKIKKSKLKYIKVIVS